MNCMRIDKRLLGLVVLTTVLLAAAASSWGKGAVDVGYVNSQVLLDQYVIPTVEPILTQEREQLQAQFDEATDELEIEEKRRVFDEYQAKLDMRRQALVEEALGRVRAAIQEVAVAEGVDMVLDYQVVLYGGRDLTEQVLAKLGL
jgi:outer membrane protein